MEKKSYIVVCIFFFVCIVTIPAYAQSVSALFGYFNPDAIVSLTDLPDSAVDPTRFDQMISVKEITPANVTIQSPFATDIAGVKMTNYTVTYQSLSLQQVAGYMQQIRGTLPASSSLEQTLALQAGVGYEIAAKLGSIQQKKLTIGSTEDSTFEFQLSTTDGLDPSRIYFMSICPSNTTDVLGVCSNQICFSLQSLAVGQGEQCGTNPTSPQASSMLESIANQSRSVSTSPSSDQGTISITQNASANNAMVTEVVSLGYKTPTDRERVQQFMAAQELTHGAGPDMGASNITHMQNGDMVRLQRNAMLDASELELFLRDEDKQFFRKLATVNPSQGYFDMQLNRNGEFSVKFVALDGSRQPAGKEKIYTFTVQNISTPGQDITIPVQPQVQPEIKTVPKVGPELYIAFSLLFALLAYMCYRLYSNTDRPK